ncbi:MAG TPA: anion transporter [Rectinemataceae bacterium]
MESYSLISYFVLAIGFIGIAIGRLPRLAMNRSTIALSAAVLLVLSGGISLARAFEAVDTETLALLLAMMVLVASLRLSGFFDLAGEAILRFASGPRVLLALVVLSSGFLSALFLNDTICIMLTPLVAEIVRRRGRDGRPYLIALATAANAGSCATSIGNPQNMLIASQSGIPFLRFVASLAPPSLIALLLCYVCVLAAFPSEFRRAEKFGAISSFPPQALDRRLLYKSLAGALLLLILLGLGVCTSLAALSAAAFLLVTRRTDPVRIFAEIDLSLLVFFSGLFVLTAGVAGSPAFALFMRAATPALGKPGFPFSAVVALASNLVSNVPAVMLLSPVAKGFSNPESGWLFLAMASTYAGNLSLLGSVANLIMAESGEKAGIRVTFLDYLKVGLPVTLLSLAAGSVWLGSVIGA